MLKGKTSLNKKQLTNKNWLVVLLIIVVLLGIFFRITNIDQKPYWHDEIYTSLRISGYTSAEVTEKLTNKIISPQDILKYQCPSSKKNINDTIKTLIKDDPQHPPLFYSQVSIWSRIFGCSISTTRSFAAIFSLLTLPTMYFLCEELFQIPLLSGITVALISISPVHIRYAQEARQYSLWAFLTLLSSLFLLRAIKRNNALNWTLYTISIFLNLYCHLLSVFVYLGHGIFIFFSKYPFKHKIISNYLIACFSGFVFFIPWLKVLNENKSYAKNLISWLSYDIQFQVMLKKWSLNLSRIFVSWDYNLNDWLIYLGIPIILICCYSFYTVYKKNSNLIWMFVFTLTFTTAFCLVGKDLIQKGQSSTIAQYLFPSYMGIQIAVAYFLTMKTTVSTFAYTKTNFNLWNLVLILFFSVGILSNANSLLSDTWWNWSKFDVEASKIINNYSNPLIISDASLGAIAPLIYRLKPKSKLILFASNEVEIPEDFENIFLYQISDTLRFSIEKEVNKDAKKIYQFKEDSLTVPLFKLKAEDTK